MEPTNEEAKVENSSDNGDGNDESASNSKDDESELKAEEPEVEEDKAEVESDEPNPKNEEAEGEPENPESEPTPEEDAGAGEEAEENAETGEGAEETAAAGEAEENAEAEEENDESEVKPENEEIEEESKPQDEDDGNKSEDTKQETSSSSSASKNEEIANGSASAFPEEVIPDETAEAEEEDNDNDFQELLRAKRSSVNTVYLNIQKPEITTPSFNVKKKTMCQSPSWTKRFLISLFMTALMLVYGVGGAFLFSHLEGERNDQFYQRMDKWKNDTAILLATELRQVSPYEDVWARKVFEYLDVFEKELLKARAQGYRRKDDRSRTDSWNFENSLYYSLALMSTTGSAHDVPRSDWSQYIVIAYALVGIPILLIWLGIVGRSMAHLWHHLFENVCCDKCGSSRVHPETPTVPGSRMSTIKPQSPFCVESEVQDKSSGIVAVMFSVLFLLIYYVFGSAALSVREDWTISEGMYFNFAMFVTLGPGCIHGSINSPPSRALKSPYYVTYWLIGMCLISMNVNLILLMFPSRKTKICNAHSSALEHVQPVRY